MSWLPPCVRALQSFAVFDCLSAAESGKFCLGHSFCGPLACDVSLWTCEVLTGPVDSVLSCIAGLLRSPHAGASQVLPVPE